MERTTTICRRLGTSVMLHLYVCILNHIFPLHKKIGYMSHHSTYPINPYAPLDIKLQYIMHDLIFHTAQITAYHCTHYHTRHNTRHNTPYNTANTDAVCVTNTATTHDLATTHNEHSKHRCSVCH